MTIATVIAMTGRAWARDAEGNLRELSIGDTLQEGEVLVTADGAQVQLDFGDNLDPTVIQGGQEVAMTPELGADETVAEEEATALDEDVEALLTAIDEGEGDLFADLDPTAAGAGSGAGSEGGHSFVMLARIVEHLTPLSYEYGLSQLQQIEFPEGWLPAQEEENSILGVGTQDLNADGDTVWESALADGSGQGGAGITTTTAGQFQIDTGGDELAQLEVQDANGTWVTIAADGTMLSGDYGTLSVDTDGSWTYTLSDNTTDHDTAGAILSADQVQDLFGVRVTDSDGDVSDPATLTINVNDDGPVAKDDAVGEIAEDSSVTFSVFDNDIAGADGVDLASGGAVFIKPTQGSVMDSADGIFTDIAGDDGVDLASGITVTTRPALGSVSYNGDGTFTYTANPGAEGDDSFTYTITDGDGDTSTATVTLSIAEDSTPTVTTSDLNADGDTVWESALADGSGQGGADITTTTAGQFQIETGGDALAQFEVQDASGTWVTIAADGTMLSGDYGTLSVDTDGSWTYTLSDNTTDHDTAGAILSADQVQDLFGVRVTDSDGDVSDPATLTIDVNDDGPVAKDDAASIAEDTTTPLTGDVLANDTLGADRPEEVAFDDTAASYGTFTDSGDGTWSYALDNTHAAVQGLSAGERLTETFDYTLTDADGDESQASLTVTITGQDDDVTLTGVSAEGAEQIVSEANLEDGSHPDAGALTQNGTFSFTALDVLGSLSVGGQSLSLGDLQDLSGTPVTLTSAHGTLTLTGFSGDAAGGTLSYSYTLDSTVDNDSVGGATDADYLDSFAVSLVDSDGSSAGASLDIQILDDAPTAVDDPDASIAEDTTTPLTGDVLANDTLGADRPEEVAFDDTAASYGTFTDNGDGTWGYALDNTHAAVQGLSAGERLTETFDYTLTDADGDESQASLTVTITGQDDDVTLTGVSAEVTEQIVSEANLEDGSHPDAGALTQNGTFSFTALDELGSLSVGGQSLSLGDLQDLSGTPVTLTSAHGTLTLTGFSGDAAGGTLSYSYTLDSTVDNDSVGGATDADYLDSFAVSLVDSDGSSASASLDIQILDDAPTAVADGPYGVTEDATANVVSGNVLDNDDANADQPASFVGWGSDATAIAELNSYGTLVQEADGGWSFTLDNSQAATQALTSADELTYTLHYTMADADGDEAPSTLTITISGADDDSSVVTAEASGPDHTVHEAGLIPDGSDAGSGSHSTAGEFEVAASDGIASIVIGGTTFTLAQVQAFDGTQTVTTGEGTLTLDGYSGDSFGGTVSYSYTLDATIDNDSKVPSGDDAVTPDHFDDSIDIAVNGVGGTAADDDLVIRVIDDAPTVVADGPYGVTEDAPANMVSGNVLDNDDANADQPASFVGWGSDATAIAELNSYGTLVQEADGGWSFTLDNSQAATQALTSADELTYTLHYTMADADGDEAPSTLTITISGADDDSSVVTAEASGPDHTVHEAGLMPDGSDAGSGSHSTAGEFDVAASDGIASIVIGGTTFTLAQVQAFDGTQTVTTGEGTLTLDGYSGDSFGGTVSYSYTLDATIDNDSKVPSGDDAVTPDHFDDSIDIAVNGVGGTAADDDLVIRVIDDEPTAKADTNSVGEGASVDGNVLTDDTADVFGADEAEAAGGVVGVRAAGGDTTTDASGNLGTTINGVYGTLTLAANGNYTYASTADAITGAEQDVFVYTIADGDGDLSTTTLTIDVADMTLVADDVSEEVNEAALDQTQGGDDLAAGSVTGSDPTSTAETVTGQLTVTGTGVTYALDSSTDTYGTLELNSDGSYTYTLTRPFDTTPDADDGTNTELEVESYGYTATDANGNTVSGTITIDIIDDVPSAENYYHPDAITEGSGDTVLATDAADALGINAGADGLEGTLEGITFTATGSTGGSLTITDGKLIYTAAPAGNYSDISPVDGLETFEYKVVDQDGDTVTRDVTVDLSVLKAPSNEDDTIKTGAGDDVVVADRGGKEATYDPGVNYNISLIVDSSGSMSDGSGSGVSRMQLAKDALKNLVDQLADHDGEINLQIIDFDTDAVATVVTIPASLPGNDTAVETLISQAIADAKDAIDAMVAEGGTNYEAGFEKSSDWLSNQPSDYVNKAIFLTDGNPTYYLDDNGNVQGPGSSTSQSVMNNSIDAFDGLVNAGVNGTLVDAIGIGGGINENILKFFDNTSSVGEVTASGGSWTVTAEAGQHVIVNDAAGLAAALDEGGQVDTLAPVGNDHVAGGSGDDILFGDAITPVDETQYEAGWTGILNMIESDLGHAPSNEEIMGYLKDSANAGKFETPEEQGGDDVLIGGSGSDTLWGGAGADTFKWQLNDEGSVSAPAEDSVMDFSVGDFGTDAEANKLDISELLQGASDSNRADYVFAEEDGNGNTVLHISSGGQLGNSGAGADQTIMLSDISMNSQSSDAFLQSLIDNDQLDIE